MVESVEDQLILRVPKLCLYPILQYMEASLAEVTMELLRRREDLSVRRRHRMEHEQHLKNMVFNHPHLLWSCAPTNTN